MVNLKRFLYFPVTRIIVGLLVCLLATLAANSLLRLLPGESDLLRIARWLLSLGALLGVYVWLFGRYEKRALTELAPQLLPREALLGFALGTAMIALTAGLLSVLGFYTVLSIGQLSVLGLLLFFFLTQSALEEVLFRGILYRIAEASLGTNLALLLSAALFGLLHMGNEQTDLLSFVSVMAGGVLMALFFSLTKRLWLPIFFHVGWNWAQAACGAAVSGVDELPRFLTVSVAGPDWLTGGAFGLENSLITILSILVLCGSIYIHLLKKGLLISRSKPGPAKLEE